MDVTEWYDSIAGGYEELYGIEQELKVKFIRDLYKRLFGDKKFDKGLDFGCGTGISTKFLLEICKEVYACDISKKMLEIAKKRLKHVTFLDCKELRNYKEFFDIILSVTVLQDNDNPEEILELFKEILKKDGIIILSVLKKKGISYWKPIIKKHFNILWFAEEEKDFVFFLSQKI